MPKPSHREKILCEGMKVVHSRGFANSSVRDIVEAAGVPQGSFTNHFASKEMFGLEVVNRYFEQGRTIIADTLRNDRLPPLMRLQHYIELGKNCSNQNSMRDGCMLGNFAAESSEHSEMLRKRLVEIFDSLREAIAYCLRAAVEAGELRQNFECDEVAAYMVASLQGATLLAKTQRSPEPVEQFKRMLFTKILV